MDVTIQRLELTIACCGFRVIATCFRPLAHERGFPEASRGGRPTVSSLGRRPLLEEGPVDEAESRSCCAPSVDRGASGPSPGPTVRPPAPRTTVPTAVRPGSVSATSPTTTAPAVADDQGLWRKHGLPASYKTFVDGPIQIQALGWVRGPAAGAATGDGVLSWPIRNAEPHLGTNIASVLTRPSSAGDLTVETGLGLANGPADQQAGLVLYGGDDPAGRRGVRSDVRRTARRETPDAAGAPRRRGGRGARGAGRHQHGRRALDVDRRVDFAEGTGAADRPGVARHRRGDGPLPLRTHVRRSKQWLIRRPARWLRQAGVPAAARSVRTARSTTRRRRVGTPRVGFATPQTAPLQTSSL
ncbi:hypothetical protein QFZ75_000259 [Streptomyces sp. V3I8]|nr:hypothetical protein [Streptomyces sp. V3I8]